jgi:plasmid stabilization system protein ParE
MPVLAGVRSRLCRVEELQERVARVGDGPRIVRSHAETSEEVRAFRISRPTLKLN